MNRRTFLSATLALATAPALPAFAATPPVRTRWNVVQSEGLDAIAFMGPLSGGELYRRYYAADADTFAARLPAAIHDDVPKLYAESNASSFGLLAPVLSSVISGSDVSTLDKVIEALADPETRIRPTYQRSQYWNAEDWAWLMAHRARLHALFAAMRDAGFADFRRQRIGATDARIAAVRDALSGYDVIRWQEKLTGRAFDPTINIVLLQFSKPHGVKVQGQTFLQAVDYDTATTVRIAAHEMLHPPFPMDGPAAKAALAVLEKDALISRIVRDHDPRWGYTTLDGLLNEDVCEALDQIISEALGVARDPKDRWTKADDGIHVLAAGLYGLLMADGWRESGGNIEQWIARAAASGRLAPDSLHAAASRVLGRPTDRLWPLT